MLNPIQKIRTDRGLNRVEFAALLGLSYQTVYQAENGFSTDPRVVLEALENEGENIAALREEYRIWREERQGELPEHRPDPDQGEGVL